MDFECPEYQYVYAWAGEREFPVLLHTWGQEVLRFHKLAQSFPRTIFILGHSGGEEDAARSAIEVAARHGLQLCVVRRGGGYRAGRGRLQGAVWLGRLLELYGGRSGPHFVG